jgi:predicted  nucleic acid-binding Zn-ribbon protein
LAPSILQERNMTLTREDIDFIKTNMADWLVEQSLGKPAAVYEIELRERMVRVEEELKHQRELMREGFAQMERRFELAEKRHEELRADMIARFEQVDKRFEQVDKRFESVQQDIRELQRRMDRFMVWSFSTTVAVGGLVVTLVKFWNP